MQVKIHLTVFPPFQSLMLALHKFRVTEEHKRYSVDDTEPLALFALSSGMFSSPAVSGCAYLVNMRTLAMC